jgi:hypothetical protein
MRSILKSVREQEIITVGDDPNNGEKGVKVY